MPFAIVTGACEGGGVDELAGHAKNGGRPYAAYAALYRDATSRLVDLIETI